MKDLYKDGEEEFNKEASKLLLEIIQTDKLHRVSNTEISLFGLQFACKWALQLNVDLDVASLINEYY